MDLKSHCNDTESAVVYHITKFDDNKNPIIWIIVYVS